MEVYERIRILRKSMKMSMDAFGARLGVSRDVINNIEHNRLARPDQKISLIKLMCKEFSVNEDWIFSGEGEMFAPTTRSQEVADFVGNILKGEEDNFKRRFVAMLARLDESEWEFIEQKALELFEEKKKD